MDQRPDELGRREPLDPNPGFDPATDAFDTEAVNPALRGEEGADEVEIEHVEVTRVEIERTRADMSETADAIQRKLDPETLREQAKDWLHEATEDILEQAKDRVHEATEDILEQASDRVHQATVGKAKNAGTGIVESIKQNPLPAALTGVGLGWLLANARKQAKVRARTRPPRAHNRVHTREYPPVRRDRVHWDGEEEGYSTGQALSDAKDKVGETAGQAQDRVSEISDQAQDKVEQVVGEAQDRVGYLSDQARYQARRASGGFQRMLRENPLAVGALATGVGAAVGLAIPETSKEHEVMGETRDNLVDKAQEKVQETQQKAQKVAEEVQSAAQQEAENQGLTQQ